MATKELLFKTPYGERKHHFINAGRQMQNEYAHEINKLGQKVLVKTGEYNLYEKIQEAHEDTKIENVMARCIAGDTSMLRPDGLYMDATKAPNSLLEAQQQIMALENTWNALPVETRRKYNFSVEEFIGASGTESWLRDMGMLQNEAKEAAEAMKETVKAIEPKQAIQSMEEQAKGDVKA